jgi:hypothetical protein
MKIPKPKFTISNIKQYVEGHLKMLGDKLNIIPEHESEQVRYRIEKCKNDCVQYGYCVNCGCELPGKFYVKKSCNKGGRFPDLMDAESWDEYKKENNITFE